ncbi:MAG: NAD(P)-dependent alcohol dehydrogenase [Kiritimatiellae bacterium]|nr:NAD(P)-dependent alcohol dehydrogenase [Kiritimatiellia bacterium]
MKAVVMNRYGTPDVLELKDVAKPTPKADEVLVRVHAASVNDWDWGLLHGTPFVNRMVSGLFTPKVRIIGGDIAGCVEAVGGDVSAFEQGDEVYGDLCLSGFGAFAEYVCAPEACLVHKPAGMTFEQAAAIPQAGMLAVQGLIDAGRIQSGQTLLLNGAGGGVGTFALQMAKLYEAEITVVDKPGKLEMLRAMGADHVVDYLKEDFTKGDKCYDLILDTKTNRSPLAYTRVLNPNGTYVTVGGSMPRLLQALVVGPFVSRISSKHVRIVSLKPNKDLAYMNELFEAGELVPVIEGPYKLADVPDALRFFGTGDHKGKITVTMV